MKVDFKQTRSNISASYSVIKDKKERYQAEIPFNFAGCRANLFRDGQLLYELSFDMAESLKNLIRDRVSANMLPFSIWGPSNDLLGHIFLKRSKSFFGYLFFEFKMLGKIFHVYEIGLGKDGIKITLFDNGEQIALIEKCNVVHDNKDEYQIIGIDESSVELAVLFNLYYDFVRFGRTGEFVYNSKKTHYMYSTNKELKSKYNPAFKEQYS